MYSLLYTSVAASELGTRQLHELLVEARKANTARGVTGMLLYKQGNFMQVLEGEQDIVVELSHRIARDPRHEHVFTLHAAEVAARQFPDWSMGFRDLDHSPMDDVPGYSDFMTVELTADSLMAQPDRARRLLRAFRDS